MTDNFNINGLWQGETVAILGAGPDMTAELAEKARQYKTIAVNRAIKYAPNADMFVALDPLHPFWEAAEEFKGIKICGVENEYGAHYVGMFYESVELSPNETIEIRNNALAAIRIAVLAGASKLILLGFDPERYEEVHFKKCGFRGLIKGLEKVIREVKAQGVAVERFDSEKQFPGKPRERRIKHDSQS